MASSLQTLVKILRLEQSKEYQNRAVIGGFARFAYHWAREAHSQAKADTHHALVDKIADRLRAYEAASEADRPAMIEEIIALATGDVAEEEAAVAQHLPASLEPTPVHAPPTSEPSIGQAEGQAPLTEAPHAEAKPVEGRPTRPSQSHRNAPARDKSRPRQEREDGDEFDEDSSGDDWFMQPVEPTPSEQVAIPQSVRERRGYAWQQRPDASLEALDALNTPVRALKGIGDTRAEQLERLDVQTVRDLLFFFPRRYDDYSRMKPINQLKPDEEVTVIGLIERVHVAPMKRGGKRIEAFLNDSSAALRLNWFNQPWMEYQLHEGESVVVSGRTEQYLGRLIINNPEMEPLDSDSLHTGRIVPVYPLTKGLGPRMMRGLMKEVIDAWAPRLPDHLPVQIRERVDLMDYGDALSQLHFPDSWLDKDDAHKRFAFDELFILQLAMRYQRRHWQSRQGTPLAVSDDWFAAFEGTLPYTLTAAQHRALDDIRRDIASGVPMNRLLQGDVGSGKTIVAAMAMAMAVANDIQAAIMAPTSILAEQHYENLCNVFAESPLREQVRVALLTGHTPQDEREEIYQGLASGEINVIIGTQALIQQGLNFAHLGLAIVDEQHRFGVAQRGALREKAAGGNPHLLVMTATPIPRTLALTLHADLDLSVIDEMPPGRQPVQTRVLQPKERERAYSFIRSQVEKGHQTFIIYPLVEESDKLDASSAVEGYERLRTSSFSDLRLGLVHGRMRPDEKEVAMEAFYRGETDILVSTSVIEVGIDVPNATVMLVENANRFGLAQLHQLRGRVGRGGNAGYCLLVSDRPFFDRDERLAALEETTDGFRLAEIDWQMRGAGDLVGTRQSGFGNTRFADLMNPQLVADVQREARTLVEVDPELQEAPHQLLAERVYQFLRERESGDIS